MLCGNGKSDFPASVDQQKEGGRKVKRAKTNFSANQKTAQPDTS